MADRGSNSILDAAATGEAGTLNSLDRRAHAPATRDPLPIPAPVQGGFGSDSAPRVVEMMERLRLTAIEAQLVLVDDEDEADQVDPGRALVGKVLSPNVLHINTISSAMRPAWGNPQGLLFHPAGDNLFVAEFATPADRARVLEGSPWMVGRHAVLFKDFDAEIQPTQMVFDRLTIWARIMALPPRLMKSKLGMEFAKPIGKIVRVESDADSRCWGPYMRVQAEVLVQEPVVRYVTVTSAKTKSTETYSVMYERLPFYCFSCGLLGHSSMLCPTPGVRDENGELPYAAMKVCVPDDQPKRSGGSKSSFASSSSGFFQRTSGQKTFTAGTIVSDPISQANNLAKNDVVDETEVSSPAKGGLGRGSSSRGRGHASSARGRGRGKTGGSGKELFPVSKSKKGMSGQKRKTAKDTPVQLTEGTTCSEINQLAIVLSGNSVGAAPLLEMTGDDESVKKQRTSPTRSADPAAAAEQRRQTQ
ncbi:hypothetical protein ACQJBY_038349 [Aegilops geniculata]